MDKQATDPSPARLLLNAEPFGFGPTAAIAGFFPHLRAHFATIGYMGKKHTLDLQRGLPYDAVHDVTNTPKHRRADDYAPIFSQYDILLTAMDHKIAEEAQKAGLKTFYYDALAWYWPEIPEAVRQTDLYLAQDFFGVEERLKDSFARHANAHVVPSIAPVIAPSFKKDHVLINLGGLQNPFWPIEDVIAYAKTVIAALRQAIPPSEKIVIAGSKAVAGALAHEGVVTYARADMEDILSRARYAFMTPGLGNIYDAAASRLPTVWLPPANDSQGQQLAMLEQNGLSDGALRWHDILSGPVIDYAGDQPGVLSQIAACAKKLATDADAQNTLCGLSRVYRDLARHAPFSKTENLIERFGTGGDRDVARHVIETARRCNFG